LDTKSGIITKHIALTDPENNKSLLLARCAYKDRSGNTWIGSRGDGLQKLPFPHKKFKWYRSDSSNNNVFSIYADSATVYIGSLGHGIDVFERNKGFLKNIPVNKHIKTIVNNAYTITPLGKNKMLIVGHNIKSNLNNIPLSYTKTNDKIELLNNEVQKVFADYWGRGNLRHFIFGDTDGSYLTNIGEYLVRLTACKQDQFCPQTVNHFQGETLSNCFRDREGILWIGTYSGIYYQTKTGWQKVSLPKVVEIKSINQDPAGNIWLGTPNEIYVLNGAHKLKQTHTEDNGLINGHLYGILRDDDGNMWFSHNKGLSVYRWKEKKFEHYGKEDGLQSSEFNAGAYFKAADGELFFGGINGVTSFYPREILRNPNAPAVNITGIKVFDEPYQTDLAYWNIHKLELPYTENSLSFEFAMPEYTNQVKNMYQFNMTGLDDKWINAGDRRFTRYAGLRPGNYTFKVRGANNDGVYGSETSIAITIVPPFWQQTWFIVLMIVVFILLSVGVGILIQKYRQKKEIRALELQHKIQLERERISRDLHDNVGTQLSLISKNIEGVIDPLQNVSAEERIRNLSSISQTSKEVIFTLRETIWALNREEISLEELSDKLKGFTQKLFEINATCRLLYTEDIEGEPVVLSPSEAIHLFRICQEAITNSLKYAKAATMEISISSVDNRYRISIADDGIGFAKDIKKASAHYGLENMKYRAGEIDCDFSIDSAPGEGTRITISKK
ncbi:MAG: Two component regulator propeller, partial [Sediminibacterium sp.]|nr:Two component regulator propeller [Sediminibacterium sp.]